MAAMDVLILSRKMIKPSNPTPQHLQTFKLSLFDQFTPPMYISILFYYLPTTDHFKSQKAEALHQLEESLSKALNNFYPLTGRFDEENLLIDCRDQGLEYLEAKVNSDLLNFLERGPDLDLVEELLPKCTSNDDDDCPLLSIQINLFDCGGIVLGLRAFHQVADTSTISTFINTWARRCKEDAQNERDFILRPIGDKTTNPRLYNPTSTEEEKDSTFTSITSPPHVASLFPATKDVNHAAIHFSSGTSKIVIKRLGFNGEKIAELKSRFREKYGSSFDDDKQPSRVTLVTAIIWKALITICSAKKGFLRSSVLAPAMNLRSRVVNLSLGDNTFGNFWMPYIVRFKPTNKNAIELDDIVHQLVDATREAENCARGSIDSISLAMTNAFKEVFESMGLNEIDVFPCTSWCGFNMYNADFGWGDPRWVSCSGRSLDMPTLLDMKYGKGIEAWVPLNKEDIDLFQLDPEIAQVVASSSD